jgi:hypothetical protein
MFNVNVYSADVVHKTVSAFLGEQVWFTVHPLDDRYDFSLPDNVYIPRVLVKALRTRMLHMGYSFDEFYAYCVNVFKELLEIYPFDTQRESLTVNDGVLLLSYPNDTVNFMGIANNAMITVSPDNIVKADSAAMFYSEFLANILNVPDYFRDHAYHVSPQLHNAPKAVYESWLYLHFMRNNAGRGNHDCDGYKTSFNKFVNKWLQDSENIISLPELVFKKTAPREARKPDSGSNWFMDKFPHLVKLGESDNISLHFDERRNSDYPLIVSDTVAMVHLVFNFPCREASLWEQQNMGSFFNIMFAVMNFRKDDMLERGGFIFGRLISDDFYEEFIEAMMGFTVNKNDSDGASEDSGYEHFEVRDGGLQLSNINDIVKMFATGVTVEAWGKLEGLPEEWINKL